VLKAKKVPKEGGAVVVAKDTGPSWEEKKRRRNRAKELPQRRDKAMAGIEAAEARRKAIADLYAKEGFFVRTPHDELARLHAEDEALGGRIESLLAEWEAAEKELAELAELERAEAAATGQQ